MDKTQNLEKLKSYISEIGNTKQIKGLENLLWNPARLHPRIKNNTIDVQFQNNGYSNMYATIDHSHNFKELFGQILVDMDLTKPLTSIFNDTKSQHLKDALSMFYADLMEMSKSIGKGGDKGDELAIDSLVTAGTRLNRNADHLKKAGSMVIPEKYEPMLIKFIVAHELAHLSFKDKYEVQFKYMDQAKLDPAMRSSPEIQRYLSNSLLNINRYNNNDADQSVAEGANYLSTRDEIHSDLAGAVTTAYLALKSGDFSETEVRDFFKLVGNYRFQMNETSLGEMSTHNANEVFKPHMIDRIINTSKQLIQNPRLNVYDAVQDMTEDAFFATLQKGGITMKTPAHLKESREPELGKYGRTQSVYATTMEVSNKNSKDAFDKCIKSNHNTIYDGVCYHFLNGAQKKAVDPNNDNQVDTNNLDRALVKAAKNGTLKGISAQEPRTIEKQATSIEAELLTRFAEMNNIKTKATNEFGADLIELQRNKAKGHIITVP